MLLVFRPAAVDFLDCFFLAPAECKPGVRFRGGEEAEAQPSASSILSSNSDARAAQRTASQLDFLILRAGFSRPGRGCDARLPPVCCYTTLRVALASFVSTRITSSTSSSLGSIPLPLHFLHPSRALTRSLQLSFRRISAKLLRSPCSVLAHHTTDVIETSPPHHGSLRLLNTNPLAARHSVDWLHPNPRHPSHSPPQPAQPA